jgi:hypothetical protein
MSFPHENFQALRWLGIWKYFWNYAYKIRGFIAVRQFVTIGHVEGVKV